MSLQHNDLQSSGLSERKRAQLEAEIVRTQGLVEEHLFELVNIKVLYRQADAPARELESETE